MKAPKEHPYEVHELIAAILRKQGEAYKEGNEAVWKSMIELLNVWDHSRSNPPYSSFNTKDDE